MASQKEQKRLIAQNKDHSFLDTLAHKRDMDGLHFKDVCAFILAKMGLEFDKTYTIGEMVEKIINSGNQIESIRGQKFDSSFYTGIKESFITKTQKKMISRIILEEPQQFADALNEMSDEETIDSVDIIHSQNNKGEKEELIRIHGKGGQQILIVKVPY